MKQYEAMTVEIISIEVTDIIRTSGDPYLPEPTEWVAP